MEFDQILFYIGNSVLALTGIVALYGAITFTIDIFKSKEFKDRMNARKNNKIS